MRFVLFYYLSGKANVKMKSNEFNDIGERMSVFEKTHPYSVYVFIDDNYEIEILTDFELAVCEAPGKGAFETRLIAPNDIKQADCG